MKFCRPLLVTTYSSLIIFAGCARKEVDTLSQPSVGLAQNSSFANSAAAASTAAEVINGDNILDPGAVGSLADYSIADPYYGAAMATSGFTASPYCPVVAGVRYACDYGLVHGAWFDAQKQFLASFSNGVAPAGAAYMCVSTQTKADPSATLIYGGVVPATYRPYFRHRPFAGQKAVVLGTSLTYQHAYVDYLQVRTGLATIVNKGVPGQLVRTMADNLTAADVQGAAFVSIEGVTNDYGHGYSTAGLVTDTPDMHTICGDLQYVVNKIRVLNANVLIVVMNDTWRGAYSTEPVPPAANFYGLTLEAGCQAMMDEAAALGLPHWDAYHLAGITQGNVDANTQDRLHWNDAGGQMVGNGYADYLNQLK